MAKLVILKKLEIDVHDTLHASDVLVNLDYIVYAERGTITGNLPESVTNPMGTWLTLKDNVDIFVQTTLTELVNLRFRP